MNQKTAFITGAGRGIGRATAIRFAKEGYQLGLTCQKNIEELNETVALCQQYGVSCIAFQGDAGDFSYIKNCAKDFLEHFGHIDVLVNNAGRSVVGLLTDMSIEEWNNIVSSNLTSVFNTCHAFAPNMIHNQSGRIINVSSVWGNVGASCEVAYSATKGGINAFTKAFAKELAPSKISVNAIAFGTIDTAMNQFLNQEDRNALEEEIPYGRFGTVEEAADLIYQTASAPEYLTGQIITMDGGWC